MYKIKLNPAFYRMTELISEISKADTAYYKFDNPVITDHEYDKLYDELLDLEKKTGIVLSGSPTQKTSGEILEGLKEVVHTKPMLSADKVHSIAEVVKFVAAHPALVSWKLDGMTLVLRYDNGEFQQGITRGAEGLVGEDVTHTVRVMTNVPLTIPYKGFLEVRGEGVVSWANFEELNKTTGEPYSHPRNLAAGTIRKLDASKVKDRKPEFIAFDMVTDNGMFSTKQEQLEFLCKNGFSVVPYMPLEKGITTQVIEDVFEFFNPANYPYAVDGLIVEYDDLAYGASLGATDHHENRLIAYKWEDEMHETQVTGLEVATTKAGFVSLTAVLKPVEIGGVIVRKAYLHNLNNIERLELGIGDTVKAYRANMVIPQIADNLTRSNTLPLPTHCPSCDSKLVEQSSEGGTRQLYCLNENCSAKLVRRFVRFCEKTRMNIAGMSETTLEKIIEAGLLKNFGDLYCLNKRRVEMARLPGFGPKLVDRLLNAIEKSRRCALNQFIAALGIHTIGRTAGRALNAYFGGDWNKFEQAIKDKFDFTQIEDFGPVMNENLYAWYHNPQEEELWRPALNHITFIKENTTMNHNTENPFYGKTVVATDKLEG